MSRPHERTRSVIQTQEFLLKLSCNAEIPESVRREAKRLIRHYPSAREILLVGRHEQLLLGHEVDELTLALLHTNGPVLSPTLDG